MKSGGVDTLQMFKCVRDPMGIKCRVCIVAKSCQENPRWFHKKVDLEAHLLKEHGLYMFIIPLSIVIGFIVIATLVSQRRNIGPFVKAIWHV